MCRAARRNGSKNCRRPAGTYGRGRSYRRSRRPAKRNAGVVEASLWSRLAAATLHAPISPTATFGGTIQIPPWPRFLLPRRALAPHTIQRISAAARHPGRGLKIRTFRFDDLSTLRQNGRFAALWLQVFNLHMPSTRCPFVGALLGSRKSHGDRTRDATHMGERCVR